MAYVSKEMTKKIRNALKAEFPNVKFSVRKEHSCSLSVNIMESPFFDDGERGQVNQYHIRKHFDDVKASFLEKVDEIIRKEGNYYDNSNPMIDYFETAFYYHIGVGKFDSPHVNNA